MKVLKQNLFLATVLAFAMSSSGCALLGGLLGGGGGGGIMDMLGGLIPGMTLTSEPSDSQSELGLSGSQARVQNGYRVVGGSLPQTSRQEGSLYGSFGQ